MNPALAVQRQAERASLIADLCELRREGRDPLPRLASEFQRRFLFGRSQPDPEEHEFFIRLIHEISRKEPSLTA